MTVVDTNISGVHFPHGATAAPIDDRSAVAWEKAAIPFKLQFSDVTLATLRLTLMRRSASLNEPPLREDEVPAPPPALAPGAHGYVVWSQPVLGEMPVFARRGKTVVYVPRQFERYHIDLSGDFSTYQGKFSGKSRSTIKRKVKKFAELSGGTIDWRHYKTVEEIDTFFRFARLVSEKTYQERLIGAGLPDSREFVEELRRRAEQGLVYGYILFLNGNPISYLYCPIDEGALRYSHLGYDPACADHSPGTVLQWLVVEALFAEQRFRLFDFTEGEGQHKKFFSTDSTRCADIVVVRKAAVPLMTITLHHLAGVASRGIGTILDRIGLRARIRRLLRRGELMKTATHH
jgi:hypothetical protein